jgi:hypothetical protein
MISRKIKDLDKEEDTLFKLIKETQNKYYIKKSLSAGMFQRIIKQYKKRLSKIKQQRIKLRNKRMRLLAPAKLIEDLQKEKNTLVGNLKKLQKNYYVKRKISPEDYKEFSKMTHTRLAEIEDEQETVKKMLKKKVKK